MQMNTPSPEQKDEEGVSVPNSTYDRLDEREKTAKNEKEGLTQSSTDWYSIKIQPKSVRQISKIFHSRKWEELPTLKSLKDERLKREAHELKLLKEKISTLLREAEKRIAQGKAIEAKQSLLSLRDKW